MFFSPKECGFGPIDLLVIQPTPFCNLNCSYCYLPDRNKKMTITDAVLERIYQRVFESNMLGEEMTIVWHAGEPTTLPISFYEHAFELLAQYNTAGVKVFHSFQTNGTLITPEWCAFFKRHGIRLGLSIDGPGFIHDECRKNWSNAGTFKKVQEGIRCLREHNVPFSTITVLTRKTLQYPDEMFDMFVENGIQSVGFNIEEIEGPNATSSLQPAEAQAEYKAFLSRFYDRIIDAKQPIRVREFATSIGGILHGGHGPINPQQLVPFAIVNVDLFGNFTTFSPELLGLKSDVYGDFTLGNVLRHSFDDAMQSLKFQTMFSDIVEGISECQRTCPYFQFCGGGAPVNKYFENGSFKSTETMFCRLTKKTVMDLMLDKAGV